jgi:hypothetical protein
MPATEPLTQIERQRRAELNKDSRAALALGLTLDAYRERRDDEIEAWCAYLHAEMDRLRASDPSEVLPHLAARIEERATAEARKVAEQVAKDTLRQMLRKAIT